MCDNLPKGASCLSESCALEPMSLLGSCDYEKYPFTVQTSPSIYPFLFMSVTKRGPAGRFTPQWHPWYSVALLPSMSAWLPPNISPANITQTQMFLIALNELPVQIFFKAACLPQYSTQAGQCFGPCESRCKWHLKRPGWSLKRFAFWLYFGFGLLFWDKGTKQNCFHSPLFVSFPSTRTFACFKGDFVLALRCCVCTLS